MTLLLDRARAGDSDAWNQAFELVYAELRSTARRVLGRYANQTLTPTSLVHECYLRLSGESGRKVENRAHFHALAARVMRFVLINRARDRHAAKRDDRGAQAQYITHINGQSFASADESECEAFELLVFDQAMVQLETEDSGLVRVLECRLFAGLSEEQTAAALQQSLRTTQRQFSAAKRRITELLT